MWWSTGSLLWPPIIMGRSTIYNLCMWPLVMCVISVHIHEYALRMCIDIVYVCACVVIGSACICKDLCL